MPPKARPRYYTCDGNLKLLREALQASLHLPNKLYSGIKVIRKDVIKRAALLHMLYALQRNLICPPSAMTSVVVEHAGTKKDQCNFTADDCKLFARDIGQQVRSLCRVAAQVLRKTNPPKWFTDIILPALPGQTELEDTLLFTAATETPVGIIDVDACKYFVGWSPENKLAWRRSVRDRR